MYLSFNKSASIVLAILLMTIATSSVFAQQNATANGAYSEQGITFSANEWKEVAAEAKRSGKYIFVDAYTSWCAPCRLLKSGTFKDKNAATFFNNNFINYTTDMEKGEGVELAEDWDVTAYPALLFFSPDGKMVLRNIGFVDANKLVEIGKEALAKK